MDKYNKDIFKCLLKLFSCESLLRVHDESIFQENEGPHTKKGQDNIQEREDPKQERCKRNSGGHGKGKRQTISNAAGLENDSPERRPVRKENGREKIHETM